MGNSQHYRLRPRATASVYNSSWRSLFLRHEPVRLSFACCSPRRTAQTAARPVPSPVPDESGKSSNGSTNMRRKIAGSPFPSTRPRPSSGGLADGTRSLPLLVKLVIPLALGSILYSAYFVAHRGRRTTAAAQVGLTGDGGGVGGGGGGEVKLRSSFRQLNMIGFEEGAGGGGEEWRKCREYKETELSLNKKKGEIGHDPYLQPVAPTPGAKWQLEMTDSQDAEWLGLHQFDNRYEYGSEEADRRVKRVGYCRLHMPSVPRTGSTWFRAMFETATSQPSFSMWPEGGTLKEKYKAFSSDDPCGSSLDHMEGNLRSKKKFACRDLRPPNATSPILYKSHTPFFPSYNKPSLLPEDTCMLVLLVRNPIDNHDAWQRYMVGKGPILRDYLPVWQGHLSHWVASAGDIPIYIFRYEDMLLRAEDVLRRILQTFPGGWNWSEESIAKAMRLFGPKKPFLEKCGAGIPKSSLAEVDMVRRHYGSYLKHFGYRFVEK